MSNIQKPRNLEKRFSLPLLLMTVVFVVCIIIANLVEIKTVDLPLGLTVTAGMAIFPLSYIINDCVAEVYGFRTARLVIWIGFAMSLFTAIMLNVAIALPGGEQWTSQKAMEEIYSSVPRIMAASFAAFVCGSLLNAWVMHRMKLAATLRGTDGSASFSLRAIASTVAGEGADSVIFFPCAFGGELPWDVILSLIVTQTLLKTLYEIVILPLTIRVVRLVKKLESRHPDNAAESSRQA